MGLFGDMERAAEDVVHVGEDVAGDAGGMVNALHGFLTDAGLGNVVQELAQLAEQANGLKQQLARAEASTRWSGAAADGFRRRAQQRQHQLAELVGALDSAHATVAAAYAMAGIF
ncbi:MAG TPA: hypothetical protein VH372_17145 [Actinospica sp.]|jgi:uncharacterized protein YukE|nr:hypothetical protein [Actinospica sp.]